MLSLHSPSRSPSRRVWLCLGLILAVATLLRVYHLDTESLWADEAFSVHHAGNQKWGSFLSDISATEAAPPGYYLFLHYWMQWFGDSEFAVRFPSVLFSLLSLVVFFVLVRRFTDSAMALLATAFMATFMLEVIFAQEARLYALFTFLALLVTFFFFSRLFFGLKSPSWKDYAGYALLLFLALYVNYLAFLLVVLYGLVLLYRRKEVPRASARSWLLVTAVVIVLYAGMIFPLASAQFDSINSGISPTLRSKGVPSLLAELGLFIYLFPPLLLVGFGMFIIWRKRKALPETLKMSAYRSDTFFAAFLVLLSAVYLYAVLRPVSLFGFKFTIYPLTHSYFLTRHSLFLLPLGYAYVAHRIMRIRARYLALFCIVLILLVNVFSLGVYYHLPTKGEWRDAAALIQTHVSAAPATPAAPTTPAKAIILLDKGGFSNEFLLRYYLSVPISVIKLTWSKPGREFVRVQDQELLEQVQNYPEFWLVLSRNPRTGDYYRELLDKYYPRDLSQEFYLVKVYRYRSKMQMRPETGV